MRVSLISAERSVFEGEADSVVAPAYDGLVGILPRHAAFMTLLGKGISWECHSGRLLTSVPPLVAQRY